MKLPAWLIGIALVVAFMVGAVAEHKRAGVEDLKAQIATMQFDKDAAIKAADIAASDAREIERGYRANEETINAAETVLSRDYGCVTPAERNWVRALATGKAAGANPPARPGLRAAGDGAVAQGCDSWPGYAVKVLASLLKANDIIARHRRYEEGVRHDYAAGRVSK
jgi:hypothetical protein